MNRLPEHGGCLWCRRRSGCGDHGARVAQGGFQCPGQAFSRLGEADLLLSLQLSAERHLVIVDHLLELGASWDSDGYAADTADVEDGTGASLHHDHGRCSVEGQHPIARDEIDGVRHTRAGTRPMLHDAGGRVLLTVEPIVDPVDEAVEPMVVRTERYDDLVPVLHSVGPITAAAGYRRRCIGHCTQKASDRG